MKSIFTLPYKRSLRSAIIFLLLFLGIKILAQPGTPDQSFGNKGVVVTKLHPRRPSRANDAVMQGSDKILVVGSSDTSSKFSDGKIVRYRLDGTIDSSFGINGIVTDASYDYTKDESIIAIGLQKSGKIITLERVDDFNIDYLFKVIRYYADGAIDSSFATNGVFTSRYNLQCYDLEVFEDDIFITGYEQLPKYDVNFFVQKLNSEGIPDSGFGNNGLALIGDSLHYFWAYGLKITNNKKILLAGSSRHVDSSGAIVTLRLNTNGSLDTSFGNKGMIIEENGSANFIDTDPNGNIYVTGGLDQPSRGGTNVFIYSYTSNGSPNENFGSNGKKNFQVAGGAGYGASVIIHSNKQISVAGASFSSAPVKGFVAKLNDDGSFDQSFGEGGIAVTDSSYFNGAMLQPDNKIIAVGAKNVMAVNEIKPFFCIARFNNDIILPLTILSFKGQQKSNSILLSWQAQNENNTRDFVIQRSVNGNDFTDIGSVKSNGTIHTYEFEDIQPLPNKNYYRLKMIDNDGKSTFSNIITILVNRKNIVQLFPNPVSDWLMVKGMGVSTIYIIDVNGKTVIKQQINGDTKINVKQLKAGVYFLKTITDGVMQNIKLIKQ